MRVVVIRQRPSIGDCLLLGPLLREIKSYHKGCHLTVVTDPTYLGGGLVKVFEGMPFIDKIECINSVDWTTEKNAMIQPEFTLASQTHLPPTISKANKVYDCNADFMLYERDHEGNPPLGIAEFWLRHHGFMSPQGTELLPIYKISTKAEEAVDEWLSDTTTTPIGVVLRAGGSPRDWNYGDKATQVCDHIYTRGFLPITFDPYQKSNSVYARACTGRPLDFVAAAIKRCRLLVTPDTGLLHLAQALKVPTVALWGIMDPRLRLAGYDTTLVPRQSLGVCGPGEGCPVTWRFQHWSCMHRITLQHIIEGIEEAIK